MKTHQLIIVAGLVAATTLLSACSSSGSLAHRQAAMFNKDLNQKELPIRYVVSENKYGGHTMEEEWAGTPGKSITLTSAELNADVHNAIEEHCGHSRDSLTEVRLVSQNSPVFYEVWVFDDPQSKRDDGLSGLSVVLKQLPFSGGVDFGIRGSCHATAGFSFSFN